jgi:UrcA family protein
MSTEVTLRQSSRARGVSLLCACVSTCITASFAMALNTYQPLQTVVRFDDLNLRQPRGIAILYRRLQAAAHRVCELPGQPDPVLMRQPDQCVTGAMARAITRVNRPALTSYYNSMSPSARLP